MPTTIKLPPHRPGQPHVELELAAHLTVIGANGSGKSRFGIWVEENNHNTRVVHRISAQKALTFSEYAQVRNPEEAEKELLYGRSDQLAGAGQKRASRWGNDPTTFLLNDYERLLSLLFAKDNERNHKYVAAAKTHGVFSAVPESPIDKIMRVWSDMMPHRAISLEGGKVLVGRGQPGEYQGRHMSDGERVALYLLGQCICTPPGSVVIVDEPELHMHRALMDKFWNKVEELCSDKTIIYITHDLDFAVTRHQSRITWVKAFDGSAWEWEFVDRNDDLPDALQLEILGTRKPILFCEGERGGLDHVIYQLAFPSRHVVPRGGGEKVAEATKALLANPNLHPFQPAGIVDRDVKAEPEVQALLANGVHVLPFAEIENLLCCEELIQLTAQHLGLDPTTAVGSIARLIQEALTAELELQVTLRAERRIRYKLSTYTRRGNDEAGLAQGVAELFGSVDAASEVAIARAEIQEAVGAGLNGILRVYNRKSLCARISPTLGLVQGGYQELLLRLLNGPNSIEYLNALRKHLPAL